jgi:hypothetical protein
MLITEKEASTLICWRTIAPGAFNRDSSHYEWPEIQFCGGKACMAWRWGVPLMEHAEGSKFTTQRGYCGAAGTP